jgi:ABC-type transport system involved in multi-copper enzyme maturation permease subunit
MSLLPLALSAFRDCFRRPLPYVSAASLLLLVLACRLFLGFSFGAETEEVAGLATSAFFLAGFLQIALHGSHAIRRDLEGGTLLWLLSKPLTALNYILSKYFGVLAASVALSVAVGGASLALLSLFPAETPASPSALAAAWSRAALAHVTICAAAICASSALSAVAAPLAVLALFAAGSLADLGVLPDFRLFAIEASGAAPLAPVACYSVLFSSIFLIMALMILESRAARRSP